METRIIFGKMCVCAVIILAMAGMMLPPVIGEEGKASPAVVKLTTSSAPESVIHPVVANNSDINEYRVVGYGQNAVRQPYGLYGQRQSSSGSLSWGSFTGREIATFPRRSYPTQEYTAGGGEDVYTLMARSSDIPPLKQRSKPPGSEKDTDGDGLTDVEETTAVFGYETDPHDADTDDDGLNDLQEYWWLCDPTDQDTNDDWYNDGDSVFNRLTYPYRSDNLTKDNDPDGDGLPTGAERYDTGTDYKSFSTDGDPYGDGQEYFGINMPSIAPADHPLVAAYPDLSVRLEATKVTPKATITSTTGGAKEDAWSITTETSDSESFEWGLSESVTVGLEISADPKITGEATISAQQTWANMHTTTESETKSGWTQQEWSTATTTETTEAANLKFTMNVRNRGTAPAEEITPDVSILLGEKAIATVTSPTSINSLGMGETSGNFVVDQGIVGERGEDITVTLDELRSIDCGAPLSLETLQVKAKIKKWDGEKNEWVLTGTDYSAYMNEINEGSATLMLVLRNGTYKKYKVFAGSENYNPGVTFGDAFNWTIDRDDSVPRQENQTWYFGFSGDAFDEAREWILANNSILNLTLKPNWEIVIKAQSTEPEPQIEWAFYSADMKGVCALVTDDMGIESVTAHVVMNISGVYKNLTMTDDDGDAIYVNRTDEEMEEDEGAYILATDIEGNTTNSEIAKPESPYVPPLADGDYVITAKHSSKSLTVNGNSTANRANVIQDSYWGDAHQRWKLRYVGDGYYEITAKFSCQCLEVADSRTDDGVNVRQNECKDEGNLTMSNQKWQLEDVGDGYYKILNNNSDKCLDVLWSETEDFANVGQYNYSGGDNQKWVFQPVDSYPPTMASYFAITAKELGKCLAVSNNNCVVEKYAGNDTQRMELIPVGDGYFSIIARNSSGKCLSADDGANVILRTYEGNDSQRWKVESIGGSYYKICAKNNYKCLAVNVSNVEQQEYEGKDSHRWKFETKELVTLYELTDYGGKSKRYQGVVKVPYVGEEFDNKASSLKVPAGYTVILYQYKDYRGWMKRFDSDTSDLVGDFNDNTSALVMMKKGDVPTGKIWFYEGNHATQDLVCTVSTTSDKTCQLTGGGDDCDCDNDEARSAELRWVKPGTIKCAMTQMGI